MSRYSVGDSVAWFETATLGRPNFRFDGIAGRYNVLFFMGSYSTPLVKKALDKIMEQSHRFNDVECSFFGVVISSEESEKEGLKERFPGVRYFVDNTGRISHRFGALEQESVVPGQEYSYTPFTLVLDERLRVFRVIPLKDPKKHAQELFECLDNCPPLIMDESLMSPHAPVLLVPRVFDSELCDTLIKYYESNGGKDSGFMREVNGKTVGMIDHSFKRRSDCAIEDSALRARCVDSIEHHLLPQIKRCYQFNVTMLERHIVACYEGENQGFFSAHRDNTTKGTAHRRFAVTLNLNTGDYEGGHLQFPEFGHRKYIAPRGGAVVFSCSLLHKANPVTSGTRYAYLPFLYDDEGAKVRKRNMEFIEGLEEKKEKGAGEAPIETAEKA